MSDSKLKQPLEIINVPEALLRVETVMVLCGKSRPTILRHVREGQFPQPLRINPRCTRWRAADVKAWLQAQAQQGEAA